MFIGGRTRDSGWAAEGCHGTAWQKEGSPKTEALCSGHDKFFTQCDAKKAWTPAQNVSLAIATSCTMEKKT